MQTKTDKKITRALLSVSDKTGLVDFAKKLAEHNIELLSTGGTAKALRDAGLKVKDVSAHTGFPEIMDGRVKTLHPKIHGGILAIRDHEDHQKSMKDHDIAPIDLVVVNLYPFRETLQSGADTDTVIENIDIGGPAMVRASAKNHADVTIITDPDDYSSVIQELSEQNGTTCYETRRKLAGKAFAHTAAYDSAIAKWFSSQTQTPFPKEFSMAGKLLQTLRYGENPHQRAALYCDGTKRAGVSTATMLQGKELSYNNLNDTDAAFELVSEFEAPTVAIIKHANPCGVASADTMLDAYKLAYRCDPVSAFGGIIALNRSLDAHTAKEILKIFVEVIIAPSIDSDALEILKSKPNVRVLQTGIMADPTEKRYAIKTISGGLLVQDQDFARITAADLKLVTKRAPTEKELHDLLFAFTVGKHVKSNAIVYAKNSATVGIGAGQMSRLDSSRIAARKGQDAADAIKAPENLTVGSVLASDAFFPFADGLIAAAEAGITAIIQPGGSIKDAEVIAAADERNLAMVFTGIRHFRH